MKLQAATRLQATEITALTKEQFDEWDKKRQAEYLKKHPNSSFAKAVKKDGEADVGKGLTPAGEAHAMYEEKQQSIVPGTWSTPKKYLSHSTGTNLVSEIQIPGGRKEFESLIQRARKSGYEVSLDDKGARKRLVSLNNRKTKTILQLTLNREGGITAWLCAMFVGYVPPQTRKKA